MIVESRLKSGTLTLGVTPGEDFSCQLTNIRVLSKYSDDGDPIETLCGDAKPAGKKLDGRSLAGTFVQDFDNTAGLAMYLWGHDLEDTPFEFVPNQVGAPTITGFVTLQVPDELFGGDVNTRLTSDFEWAGHDIELTPAVVDPGVEDVEAAGEAGETVDA
jgi:hypothetical protein